MAVKPDKSQREKFEEFAREIGADDAATPDATIRKLARSPKLSDEEIKAVARNVRKID